MPVPLTIVSWNITTFGQTKAKFSSTPVKKKPGETVDPPVPARIVQIVAQALVVMRADIVGIMEVTTDKGEELTYSLIGQMNAMDTRLPRGRWTGVWSSRQDGRPKEQYIFLWRGPRLGGPAISSDRVVPNEQAIPAPVWSMGVVDEQSIKAVVDAQALKDSVPTHAAWKKVCDALRGDGYVDQGTYGANKKTQRHWLVPNKWKELKDAGAAASVSVNGIVPGKEKALAKQLVAIDVLRFPTYGNRSPYVANFLISKTPLTVVLFHAPGSGDRDRFDAASILGMIDVTGDLLLMGDFNLGRNDRDAKERVYSRDQWKHPGPPSIRGVLEPIEGDLKALPKYFGIKKNGDPGDQRTSLHKSLLPATAKKDDVLNEPYDRLFFRGDKLRAANQTVHNLISAMVDTPTASRKGPSALKQFIVKLFGVYRSGSFINRDLPGETDAALEKLEEARDSLEEAQDSLEKAKAAGKGKSSSTSEARAVAKAEDAVKEAEAEVERLESMSQRLTEQLDEYKANPATPSGMYGKDIRECHLAYWRVVSDHLPISIQISK